MHLQSLLHFLAGLEVQTDGVVECRGYGHIIHRPHVSACPRMVRLLPAEPHHRALRLDGKVQRDDPAAVGTISDGRLSHVLYTCLMYVSILNDVRQ